jgi:1-acyl-sn-glycerol-3-phosphate acyltransferase
VVENSFFMRKILACFFTIIYYTFFAIILLVFHVAQFLAYNLGGYKAHKLVVDGLNICLVLNLYTLLCRPVFKGFKDLPKDKPLIIISNHQSMHDIAPVGAGFRKHHPKFISKKGLGKNLPSVSYNLQKGGSVLIDRGNGSQSIREIFKLGENLELKNYSACLFPEGTRSKNGLVKSFQSAGFKTLLKASPSAIVVPHVIDGNYKLHRYGNFPLNIGLKLNYTALKPVNRNGLSDEDLMLKVELKIKAALGQ